MGLSRRGWLSIGCAFVAAGVPLAFVYVSGAEGAEQAAAAIEAAPERLAGEAAARVALRVGDRLAALVERESRRPYFHYQAFYVDPEGAYAGDAVVPSPLADGTTDALIRAHFQIDPGGAVSLPTVAAGTGRAARPEDVALESALGAAHVAHAPELPAVASAARPAAEAGAWGNGPDMQVPVQMPVQMELQQPIEQQLAVPVQAAAPAKGGARQIVQQSATQVLRYNAKVYAQNMAAVDLYNDIKGNTYNDIKGGAKGGADEPALEGGPLPSPTKPRVSGDAGNAGPAPIAKKFAPAVEAAPDVTVRVGPFMWSSLALPEAAPAAAVPRLAAIRQVETPDGPRTQGFLLAPTALAETLTDGALQAVFEPGPPRGVGEAQVPIPGATWRVRVPFEASRDAALAEAETARTSFLPRFAMLAGLAGLAALAIVLLVIQSERLLARRQQFAAAAAHELRTPLAGVRMYAEMLAHGLGKPEKQRQYAERVANEAGRLGRVVANVLDFTRLERGGLRVTPSVGDLVKATQEVVMHLEPAIQAAGASVAVIVSAGTPGGVGTAGTGIPAVFDPDVLSQVLANLVDNAEKYARDASDRRIEVTLATGERGPELRVRDHGPGFPKGFERRIFRPFARGVANDGPAGLGLGLALTRALVKAQGGSVRLGRPAEGGAEVIVTFAQ